MSAQRPIVLGRRTLLQGVAASGLLLTFADVAAAEPPTSAVDRPRVDCVEATASRMRSSAPRLSGPSRGPSSSRTASLSASMPRRWPRMVSLVPERYQ